ncbi:hypothetical protein [Salinisphaera japonica]|uniref:hypothetical protein n=1 Tax=Salinisphaera japonica TaxID=1304270 RepID=UPI001608D9B0|nr:hypothetical protein [Salinisphaera japonica]
MAQEVSRFLYAPLSLWRSRHGKSLTLVGCSLACLFTGHVLLFELLLVIALYAYGLEL